MRTLIPGTLTILSAYPGPPFDLMKDGIATGFDVELMRAVQREIVSPAGTNRAVS